VNDYEFLGAGRDINHPDTLIYVGLRFGENIVYIFIDVSLGISPYVLFEGDDLTKFVSVRRNEGSTSSFRMTYNGYNFDNTRFICSSDWVSFNPNDATGYRIENMFGTATNCRFDLVLDIERITVLVEDGKIKYAFRNGDSVLD